MLKSYFLLLITGLFCAHDSKAFPDTVYFGADWNLSSVEDYSYFRVLTMQEDVVSVTDHYSNGQVHMTGSINPGKESLEQAKTSPDLEGHQVGEFHWYLQTGWMYLTIDYNPSVDCLEPHLLDCVDKRSLRYEKKYFQNGDLKEEGFFTSDGVRHGKHIIYYETGHIYSETMYEKGVITGTKYTYTENGVRSSSTQYEKGEKHGTQELYDYLGRLKTTRIYEHGKMVKERKRYLSVTRVK